METRDKIAHLLRRFGFGASQQELVFFENLGLQGTIDNLLESAKSPDNWDVDPQEYSNDKGVVNLRIIQALWYLRMITTNKPLNEKLTLFWHHHFAISGQKVESSFVMSEYVDVLRSYGAGNFGRLLTAISKTPAMLYFLDNNLNIKGKPNENFGREVMELFTLGIGHYTEKDVQEGARAFTGWGFGSGIGAGTEGPRRLEKFYFDAKNHDNGIKNFIGKSGNFNGDDVLKILAEQPQTALYISQKMWEFFGSSTPSKTSIDRSAKKFRDSGMEISALVRSIMEDPEFYSERVVRRLIKNPIEITVSTARQLGSGKIATDIIAFGRRSPQINPQNGINQVLIRSLAPALAARQATSTMGMELLYPPDVSGWDLGESWINSATMIARMKWGEQLFQGGRPTPTTNLAAPAAGRTGPQVGINAWTILSKYTEPENAVIRLLSVFDADLPKNRLAILTDSIQTISGGKVTISNANAVARQVSRLLCGMPEFQMN